MRDLPLALEGRGNKCTVVMPGYGFLSQLPGARPAGQVKTRFGGKTTSVSVYRVPAGEHGVECLLLEHPDFAPCGSGNIYCDDPPHRPFASDASKFALFSAAAASYVLSLERKPDIVHLNDWHTAFYLLLREHDPAFAGLKTVRTVFTIHNLALQGIRPLDGDSSSLQAWFPQLRYQKANLTDPRYANCVNPMAVGIRLADAVSTVSPTYAREILLAGTDGGGEGLEADLNAAAKARRLVGILNGCDYEEDSSPAVDWDRLRRLMADAVLRWTSQEPTVATAHFFADRAVARLPERRPAPLLTSIGRLVPQKAALFLQALPDGRPALEHILDLVGDDGLLVVLGSGDSHLEAEFTRLGARHPTLLFLNGYDTELASALYNNGDLFLMPSSFEPCGISQMLAMRAGQPCVVNDVGGLHDTVVNEETGFVFRGKTPASQASQFVRTVKKAIGMQRQKPAAFEALAARAAAVRFSWDDAARRYDEDLYRA